MSLFTKALFCMHHMLVTLVCIQAIGLSWRSTLPCLCRL